ncbi:uncharacterized protein LOC135389386 [Ornithodoros turicata]|uniref:uncharacterized protein LOC135389386 n=1 Tax=Ornithodoros turicata TaxID=34597 RepID=UPI003138864D
MVLLFFRMAEVHKIPHSTTETIFSDFKTVVKNILFNFATEIKRKTHQEGDGTSQEIDTLQNCDFIEEVFECTSNKYQREKYAKENMPYVRPQQLSLEDGGNFQYIPVINVLRNLMMSEYFCAHLSDFAADQNEGTHFYDFRDGLLLKNKISDLLQGGSQFTLFFLIYTDEVEIANPLGPKRGQHKLIVVYLSVLNIHAKYRSQLSSIFVAVVAKYKYVQRHGLARIMKQLVDDLRVLADVGFTVQHSGNTVRVRGFVVACCGDNLSLNKLGGFNTSFSKGHSCRWCLVSMEDIQAVFHEKNVQHRTMDMHMSHVAAALSDSNLSKRLYGVGEQSLLLGIHYFDLSLQLPPDLMHDVLEGAIPHVLREVLNGLISDSVISFSDLDRVATFNYGHHEKKQKPEPLTRHFVQGQTGYKGTASQKWCLFYVFPLVFAELIPEGNEHWEIYLQLRGIVEIIFADELLKDYLAYLQDEIRLFLSAFSAMYPGKMIPKMHFLLHYPRVISELGPLKQYWCMRFEAKHQYIKMIATPELQKYLLLSSSEAPALAEH